MPEDGCTGGHLQRTSRSPRPFGPPVPLLRRPAGRNARLPDVQSKVSEVNDATRSLNSSPCTNVRIWYRVRRRNRRTCGRARPGRLRARPRRARRRRLPGGDARRGAAPNDEPAPLDRDAAEETSQAGWTRCLPASRGGGAEVRQSAGGLQNPRVETEAASCSRLRAPAGTASIPLAAAKAGRFSAPAHREPDFRNASLREKSQQPLR